VLQRIVARGGRVTLSDDSHGAREVARYYGRMRDYLVAHGVQTVHRLVRHGAPGEGRVAVELVADWHMHPFWSTLAGHEVIS
jgi:histidinol-phosphatase (PHP family)